MGAAEGVGLRKHVDPSSLVVIALTLVLFLAALVVKGLGHDLLLEAGVFLVSVKLIIMAYKSSVATRTITEDLAVVRAGIARLEAGMPPSARGGNAAAPSGKVKEGKAV